ncbi:MAG: hypothetical protein MK212_18830 [Saprospiraceae bacterium]|nr:hypothetical protein [Saprospiraceae bacterium]
MNYINNFQKIGLTIAALVFSFGFLFQSINSATANTDLSPDAAEWKTTNSPNTMCSENGRYMMDYNSVYDASAGRVNWYVLVWDTQTGRSKAYYAGSKGWYESGADFQLPSNPLD